MVGFVLFSFGSHNESFEDRSHYVSTSLHFKKHKQIPNSGELLLAPWHCDPEGSCWPQSLASRPTQINSKDPFTITYRVWCLRKRLTPEARGGK